METVSMCKTKCILSVYDSIVAVLGDSSRYPMYIKKYKSAIKYWLKNLKCHRKELSRKWYKMMLNDDYYGLFNLVLYVKNVYKTTVLAMCGMTKKFNMKTIL
jgi:hypothetical protein